MSKSKSKKKKTNPNIQRGSNKNFKPVKPVAPLEVEKDEELKEVEADEIITLPNSQSADASSDNAVVQDAETNATDAGGAESAENESSTHSEAGDTVATAKLSRAELKAQKKALKDAEQEAKASEKAKAEQAKAKASSKKPAKEKRKFGSRIKETASELKKVSWPSAKETAKKTGVVIAVVLFFAVVLFGIDRLFAWLYSLFTAGI